MHALLIQVYFGGAERLSGDDSPFPFFQCVQFGEVVLLRGQLFKRKRDVADYMFLGAAVDPEQLPKKTAIRIAFCAFFHDPGSVQPGKLSQLRSLAASGRLEELPVGTPFDYTVSCLSLRHTCACVALAHPIVEI